MGTTFSRVEEALMTDPQIQEQRKITQIALEAASEYGFALAGSGAIREYGLIERPTEDIDLFTVSSMGLQFSHAVGIVRTRLAAAGYSITVETDTPTFVRLSVQGTGGFATEIDLGVDWRSTKPVQLDIGDVLDRKDAVANKVAALFSRQETRDYLDVDAIRSKGVYSDNELLELAVDADPGFDLQLFCDVLRRVDLIAPEQVAIYGFNAGDLRGMKERLNCWRKTLLEQLDKQINPSI